MTAIENELLDLYMRKEQEQEKEREELQKLLSGIFGQNQQIINILLKVLSSGSEKENLENILNRVFEQFLVSLEESNKNLLEEMKRP